MSNRRQGDVVADIKRAVNPGAYDLLKAEGRADFDDALRAKLLKIEDKAVRAHAAEMIRQWRQELFYPGIMLRERLAREAEEAEKVARDG